MDLFHVVSQVEQRLRRQAQLRGGRLPVPTAASLARLVQTLEGLAGAGARELEDVAVQIRACRACGLARLRRNVVVGEGNPRAELVFVGEAPGEEEDLQGRPFVGPAGKLLDRIIQSMGFTRQEVFIANVLKCRPPANRIPRPDEVEACVPFLMRQLKAINPRVICALGAVAAKALLGTAGGGITTLRGKWQRWGTVPVMPTYHPSYLLRNPDRKREVWEDMKEILRSLGRRVPKARRSGRSTAEEGERHGG